MILLGIKGLKRVLANEEFSYSYKVEVATKEYEKENNPVISFVEEYGLNNIENEEAKEIYGEYCKFCLDDNLQPCSRTTFTKQFCSRYDFESKSVRVKGEQIRVFKRKESDNAN